MKQISEELITFFSSLTPFTSVMNDRLFPLVANEGTDFPFSIYKIEQQTGITKDAGYGYAISLFAYFLPENYEEAVDFNDAIVSLLESTSSIYDYIDSSIDYIEENQSIVVLISFKK